MRADPVITPDEFAVAYAVRSGVDLDWLLQHRRVVRCYCDADECEGWAMVPHDADDDDDPPSP